MKLTVLFCLLAVPGLVLGSNAPASTAFAGADTVLTQQQHSVISQSQVSAGQWGLSLPEWTQYQALMEGERGILSPGLDPLTALGVETDKPEERRHFAELWVKHEFARAEKELAFQREINAAWRRLYPETLVVDIGHNATGIAHDTQGRLALFVKEDCSRCDARLAAVLADDRAVDIYLVSGQEDDSIVRGWAIRHGIPAAKVRSGQITLNHDHGLWLRYGQGLMPVVLQQREGGWQLAAF
ncbi:MAG TPA: TIGR03759 family integrating conjugative element protein [Scandinavium sp.]|jgi:integrating conjugative element protein (TIGR03759 family)